MAKRKKRNQKLDIQELMDRTSRHEREYREQRQGHNTIDIEHIVPKSVTLHADVKAPDFKDSVSETKEELELRLNVLNEMLGSGVFTSEEIEAVRDGKIAIQDIQIGARIKRESQRIESQSAVSVEPPKSAEYLAYLFLPKTDRETLLGDLTEEYPSVVEKFGRRGAQFYFYKQVVWSIWPLVRKSIIKWGLFGWLVDLIRRISS